MTDKEKELRSINETMDRAMMAMHVINSAQSRLWDLHHKIKKYDEKLGMTVWELSLQIEHALKIINEEIFAGEGYL